MIYLAATVRNLTVGVCQEVSFSFRLSLLIVVASGIASLFVTVRIICSKAIGSIRIDIGIIMVYFYLALGTA